MDENKKRQMKKMWVGKIETADDAEAVIKNACYGFFILAGLQALVGFLLGGLYLVDAVLFAGLGLWLLKGKSRVAAISLFLVCLMSLGTTFMNKVSPGKLGGNNIFLALVILYVSIRTILATFALAKIRKADPKRSK